MTFYSPAHENHWFVFLRMQAGFFVHLFIIKYEKCFTLTDILTYTTACNNFTLLLHVQIKVGDM
jgi:hypothetical protein